MRYDAQGEVRAYLQERLPDAVVRVSAPVPLPEKFLLVRREGGRRLDRHRDSAGIGVFVWASTEAQTYELAARMSEAMQNLVYKEGVADVREETLMSSPDPEDRKPRWYGSYTLITYNIFRSE